jgi:poly-gamma-glutamate capsule biosynthesis protein CapA/YwtB (metallophosphatase superfamily)
MFGESGGTPVSAGRSNDGTDAAAAVRRVRVFLAGDVMTGRGVDQILPHPCDPALHESWVRDARSYVVLAERRSGPIPRPVAFSYVWGDALAVWRDRKPDLRIVNLETSVTTSETYWPAKGIHYRMNPRNVPCLTAAAFDCCVLANNHVMDWGLEGLGETLKTLHGVEVATAGAGADEEAAARPARLSCRGGDVLVFGFADRSSGVPSSWRAAGRHGGVNLLPDLSPASAGQAARAIRRATTGSPLLVIVSVHWGGNWGYRVTPEQRAFAHRLIDDAGVDILHGHSTHHAVGIECYRGKTILYGCGDFLNDYEGIEGHEEYRPWLAPMYFLEVSDDERYVQQLEIVPMSLRQLRLVHADAADVGWLAATLDAASKPLGTRVEQTDTGLAVRPSRDA